MNLVATTQLERLLKGVVKAARQMLVARDLQSGFSQVLNALCESMDQTRVLLFQYDAQKKGAQLVTESLFVGCPSVFGDFPQLLLDKDFPEVIEPLLRGEIYTSKTSSKSGKNYEINSITATTFDLMLPIFVNGEYWGNICFDRVGCEHAFSKAEIEVLIGASAVLASAIEKDTREREIQLEHLRRDALNSALVKCNTVLLEGSDFYLSVEKALDHLREAAGLQYAKLIQVLDTDIENGEWELISEAVADGYTRQKASSIVRGSNTLVANPLQKFLDGVDWLDGAPSSFDCELFNIASRELNVLYSVCFRIVIKGKLWGLLALDDCLSNRTRSESEKYILVDAARSFGLAIDRYKKQQENIGIEQSRAAIAEQARATEERRRKLLETVTEVSDQLLSSVSWKEHADDIVGNIGLSLGVDRVCLGKYLKPNEQSRLGYLDLDVEWVRPPIERQTDDPDLKIFNLDYYEEIFVSLSQGKPIQIHTQKISTQTARSEQEATGAKSQFQYPIMVDGELWGTIGADDCTKSREWPEEEISTLQILASAFANVIKREKLTHQRIEIERQRVKALSLTNEVLGSSISALSESTTPDQVVQWITTLMARTVEGDTAAIYRVNDKERTLELVEKIDGGDGGPIESHLSTISLDAIKDWEHIIQSSEPTLISPSDTTPFRVCPTETKPIPAEKLDEWFINFPLMMNHQPRWFITISIMDRSKLSESSLDLFKTLSHQLVLALELKRLGDASIEAQVAEARTQAENQALEERAKLSGQIHDTLAQGFTGTILHLEALIVRLKRGESIEPDALDIVRKIAAFGLAEARRTAVTMRPRKLDGRSFSDALHQLVERSTIPDLLQCTIQIEGRQRKLPYVIEEMFLSIAHEAFNNAIRHAQASRIAIDLYFRTNAVALVITDDGNGFNTSILETSDRTFGLVGISRRASENNAEFNITSQSEKGTTISVEWKEPG
ncbi:GAF domain-containing sensor histidine kinase [Marinibactrum halimedae]|uniref:GAF domain-containing protein n=2 Tax=Marinibactrum halimedae TaxID=1444977 RepID=A0AA37TEB4_9GAMM|nr:GAF domain-containing protein [Marinibactrum halimedae]MCD9459440.1 GAF domain-containing protein [Marinibactrum halimedae]GLS27492.1 hypothetical protein GCM10007877_32110 [Marinibactrum halimedae]